MHLSPLSLTLLLTLPALSTASQADPTLGSTLNVTVLGARHNRSTLECWALQPGFETSAQAGTSGSSVLDMGVATGNASFTAIAAGFDGGRHNAPALQWVVFLSGLAHITLPNSTAEAWIEGGKNGALLALDTADVSALGHYTVYPSKERTVALQIPLGEDGIPNHHVLHGGACQGDELLD